MKIYLVGGAVRDRLLNIPVTDNDYVVVGSTVEEMLSLGYRQVGNSFPVFLEPKTNCEYALARKERKEGHGYNGFCFDFAPDITLEEDLIRRDLTINAIAEDPDGNIIDPCGGREDLKKKVLRHINDSFAEDPLRVLRVARFAARFNHLGFTVAPETMELMKSMVLQGEINYLTPERIFLEFNKVLINGDADIFIKILRNCGALGVVFPEMDNLYGIPARKYWLPEIDTGTHMELCLSYACRHNYEPIEKFAIFCHDFGKALTDKNILPSHTNHGKKGVPLIEKFCDRLRIPNNYRKVAEFIAREHSMVHTALYKSNKEILELLKRIDAFRNPVHVNYLLNCCKADFHGRLGFENLQYTHPKLIEDLFIQIKDIKPNELIKQGYKGAQISEKLDELRLETMEQYRSNWNIEHAEELKSEKKEDPEWIKQKKLRQSLQK